MENSNCLLFTSPRVKIGRWLKMFSPGLIDLITTCIICMALLFSATPSFSEMKTFIREYAYDAGEMDSNISCRAIALEQVKRLLLEELGTYV